MKRSKTVGKVLDYGFTYGILLIVSFLFVFPCLWLILASFSKSGSIYSFNGFFPTEYSLDTFVKLFTDTQMYDFPKWFLNSLVVGIFSMAMYDLLRGHLNKLIGGMESACGSVLRRLSPKIRK